MIKLTKLNGYNTEFAIWVNPNYIVTMETECRDSERFPKVTRIMVKTGDMPSCFVVTETPEKICDLINPKESD